MTLEQYGMVPPYTVYLVPMLPRQCDVHGCQKSRPTCQLSHFEAANHMRTKEQGDAKGY